LSCGLRHRNKTTETAEVKFHTDQLGDCTSNAVQLCALYRSPRHSPRSCLSLFCPSRCTVPTLNSSHAAGIGAPYVLQCKAWVSNPQAVCISPGCIYAARGHIYRLCTYYTNFTIFQAVIYTTCCCFFSKCGTRTGPQ